MESWAGEIGAETEATGGTSCIYHLCKLGQWLRMPPPPPSLPLILLGFPYY